MSRYHFRLESVLRVRRTQERATKIALASANRNVESALALVHRRLDRYHDLTEDPVGAAPVTVAEVRSHLQLVQLASEALLDAGLLHRRARDLADEARQSYLDAARRVSALERLDERRRDEHRLAEERAEGREVDDLVVGRHGRRGLS